MMIGRLSGTLVAKQPPHLMVDVHGVGYELEAPMSTVYELPAIGQPVVLFVHQQVREDAVNLYGFHRDAERSLFRTLLKVSGVGAKTALAILSGASVDEFARLVRNGEITALTRIPGIGKKTAERIVVELRDRVAGIEGVGVGGLAVGPPTDPASEARIALEALGYKPVEAERLVAKAAADGDDAEAIIRKALRAVLR
jgi:Holliday junction DNA helicase RuvA